MKLLIISGDTALAQGKKGPFYYMLEEFSKYWERIDIICPCISNKVAEGDRSTKRSGQPFQPFNNVFVHSSPWHKIFQPWFILKKGLEIYQKEKFDLFTVHSYPPFYNDIGGRWLYSRIGIPYGLEMMHITGYPKAGNFKDWFYKILTRLFIKFSAKNAIAVRVINQSQVPEFLKKSGIQEEKIKFAAASYIDLETFYPQNLDKKYDVVFSGRLVKNKGIKLLLKAVKELKVKSLPRRQAGQKLKVIIVGDGPLRTKIEKYIIKNRLQDNVELAGWLPCIEDLARIYNQSRIMVMPSFNEGGPRVTLEAMACKVPVITSRVGIMLDIIKHGGNGLFIDWNAEDITEKILSLSNNDNLRKKIAENGYQAVQQFERKKTIRQYAIQYQKLINNSNL